MCKHEERDFESYDTNLKCAKKNVITYGCNDLNSTKCEYFEEKTMEKVRCTSCGHDNNKSELKKGLCEKCHAWDLKQKEFEGLAKPLIEFINKHYHNHTSIIIDSTHAEILEGVMVTETEEFLKD